MAENVDHLMGDQNACTDIPIGSSSAENVAIDVKSASINHHSPRNMLSILSKILRATVALAISSVLVLFSLLRNLLPLIALFILFIFFAGAWSTITAFKSFMSDAFFSSETFMSEINNHPSASAGKRRFMFEPIGYSYGAATAVSPTLESVIPSKPECLTYTFGNGYYSKDASALYEMMQKISIYKPPPRAQEQPEENGTDIMDEIQIKMFIEDVVRISSNHSDCPVFDVGNSWGKHVQMSRKTDLSKHQQPSPGTVIVLDLNAGSFPTEEGVTTFVRDAVTFLLGQFRDRKFSKRNVPRRFEVILRIKSNGGVLAQYGLLAEQLRRLRNEEGITLTVCCDEAAMSGGYLVAAVASPGQLLASPFASIGSIGVIVNEILNFRKLLESFGVQSYEFQSGPAKQPMSMFGDIQQDKIDVMEARVQASHNAFRQHVETMRGSKITDYNEISNGNHWTGIEALNLGLVDRLVTSDEYIDERIRNGDRVIKLDKYNALRQSPWSELFGAGLSHETFMSAKEWWSESCHVLINCLKVLSVLITVATNTLSSAIL